MLRYLNSVDATPDMSVPGLSVMASSFGRDIAAVLDAAGATSSELLLLAVRAVVCLDIALRDAAGAPDDGRWRAAYKALDDFIAGCPRRAHGIGISAPVARLSAFLSENADLRQPLGGSEASLGVAIAGEGARTA